MCDQAVIPHESDRKYITSQSKASDTQIDRLIDVIAQDFKDFAAPSRLAPLRTRSSSKHWNYRWPCNNAIATQVKTKQ